MDQIESWLLYLCCPACLGELVAMGEALVCAGCEMTYPVIAGIPVLRTDATPATEMRRVEQPLEMML